MAACLVGVIGLTGCEDAKTPWDRHVDQGDLLFQQGRIKEAKEQYTAALDVAETFGEQDSRLPRTLTKLAGLHDTQGEYEQAEPLLSRAVSLNEKILGDRDPQFAVSLSNLAALYHAQQHYEKALPLFERALHVREQALGADHIDLTLDLKNLAGVLAAQEHYAQAETHLTRALDDY